MLTKPIIQIHITVIEEKICSSCGHKESDHIEEDDNSYCLGNLESISVGYSKVCCKCVRFKSK